METNMNERIKQITGQVLDEIVPDTWTTLGYDKIKQIQYRTAELIVRECMDITKQCSTGNGIHDLFADEIITQHFGVEE
jgi:hypothetical protein